MSGTAISRGKGRASHRTQADRAVPRGLLAGGEVAEAAAEHAKRTEVARCATTSGCRVLGSPAAIWQAAGKQRRHKGQGEVLGVEWGHSQGLTWGLGLRF